MREQYNIPKKCFVIVTAGKLERRKKIDLLIDAVRRTNRSDIHVLIIGTFPPNDPENENAIKSAAARLSGQVHFAGWLGHEEIYRHFAASDIAIFPGSQSVLWQQAIAAGLPVIVGDNYGQQNFYLNPHKNMIVLEPSQVTIEVLSKLIEELYRDPDRREAMSVGSIRTADELLDWNVLIGKTLRYNAGATAQRNERRG